MDWAKTSGVKQFLFISSAGIYKSTEEPPHVEGVIIIKHTQKRQLTIDLINNVFLVQMCRTQ